MSEFVFELVDNCTKTGIFFKVDEKNIFHSQFLAKKVAIDAFFSGRIDKVGNLAGVKYLAYSMSDSCLQRS